MWDEDVHLELEIKCRDESPLQIWAKVVGTVLKVYTVLQKIRALKRVFMSL